MRKILTFFSASALALGMGTALGASSDKASTAETNQAVAKKAPSFMFVLSAKQAELKKGKDGSTLLVIKKSDLDQTIEFSDRPYRIVKYTTGSDLAKDWSEGENSFAADPPNAVLSSANLKPHIVVLNGISITDDVLTFNFKGMPLQGDIVTHAIRSFVMTIDDKCMCEVDLLYCFIHKV